MRELTRGVLLEWVLNHDTILHDALSSMAESCDRSANKLADEEPALSRVLRESAESWRHYAAELRRLVDRAEEVAEA
jgi:hypothetical protein